MVTISYEKDIPERDIILQIQTNKQIYSKALILDLLGIVIDLYESGLQELLSTPNLIKTRFRLRVSSF